VLTDRSNLVKLHLVDLRQKLESSRVQPGFCWIRTFYVPYPHYRISLQYIPTYCMEQSPSCEANRFSDSRDFPRNLWNPKVRYRIWRSEDRASWYILIIKPTRC